MGTSSLPIGSKELKDPDVVGLWLRRQRSQATRSVYSRDVCRLTTWSDKTLPETDPLDLERFAEMLAESGLAPISQRRTLAAIRSFFRFAERIGYCRNVVAGLELPRTDAPFSERIIPQQDVRRLIAMEPEGATGLFGPHIQRVCVSPKRAGCAGAIWRRAAMPARS
jgi:site-specific recombinase XerD